MDAVTECELSHDFTALPLYPCAMIILAAFARLSAAPEPQPNDLLAKSRAALGHLGLTIIALVFVMLTFCKG
jgi:hypothetical protein